MNHEPCKSFAKYQAKFVPRCNCVPCWFKYFEVNVAKTRTAALAIQKFGEEVIERVQGSKYLKFLKLYLEKENNGNTAH